MDDHRVDEFRDLVQQVIASGWIEAEVEQTPHAVRVRFRDAPYAADWPGMRTRYSVGSTTKEAYRVVLEQIKDEQDWGLRD